MITASDGCHSRNQVVGASHQLIMSRGILEVGGFRSLRDGPSGGVNKVLCLNAEKVPPILNNGGVTALIVRRSMNSDGISLANGW